MGSLVATAGLTWRAFWRLRVGGLLWLLVGLLVWLGEGPAAESLVQGILGPGQSVLLVAALWLAADLASREYADQTIQALAVRPAGALALLLGRWLGLLAGLLPLLLALGVGLALRLEEPPDGWRWQAPVPPDVRAEAAAAVARLEAVRPLADEVERELARREASGRLRLAWLTVGPGESRTWTLPEAAGPSPEVLELCPLAEGLSQPGRGRAWLTRGGSTLGEWRLEPLQNDQRLPVRAAAGLTGPMEIGFANDGPEPVAFRPGDGFRAGYREVGFGGNLARTLLLFAGQLATVTALGLLLGTAVSFPVAAFVGLGWLSAAWLVGLVADRIPARVLWLGRTGLLHPALEWLAQGGVKLGYGLTIVVNGAQPVADLAAGVAVPWRAVLGVGLGAGLAGALGLLGLAAGWQARREAGAVAS